MTFPVIMDLSGLISNLNTGPVEVLRGLPPQQNEYGGWEKASAQKRFTLQEATIHTLSGRALENFPEADRNTELVEVYTKERLHAADDGQAADRLCWHDRVYRVVKAFNERQAGNVYLAYAALEEPGGDLT